MIELKTRRSLSERTTTKIKKPEGRFEHSRKTGSLAGIDASEYLLVKLVKKEKKTTKTKKLWF